MLTSSGISLSMAMLRIFVYHQACCGSLMYLCIIGKRSPPIEKMQYICYFFSIKDIVMVTQLMILYTFEKYFLLVRMKHLMEHIQRMWWSIARVAAYTYLQEFSSLRARSISPGSRSMTKTAI